MPNQADIQKVRDTADKVLETARNDEAYRTALLDDPVAVLIAAGVPDDAARTIGLQEWQAGGDAQGFMRPSKGPMECDGFTCWVTWCGCVPMTNG